jgi:hypothetical protein
MWRPRTSHVDWHYKIVMKILGTEGTGISFNRLLLRLSYLNTLLEHIEGILLLYMEF